MIPYDEQQVVQFAIDVNSTLEGKDFGRVGVVCSRMQYDACNGMGYLASRAKHLRELKDELGIPVNPKVGPRPPLPAFPTPVDYRIELPWTPPNERDFLRGDSWGITMDGFPWVPGASQRHPERVLSWFLDRYNPAHREAYLRVYADRYTHIKLSYDDSTGRVDNGPNSPPGNGQSLEQFVQTCLEAKSKVPYVQVMLASKYWTEDSPSPAAYRAKFEPVIDALLRAGAVDELVPGWEWNLWNGRNAGRNTIDIFKWVGQKAHAAGKSNWLHFAPHYVSWFADGDPRGRFGFWDDLGDDVNGINYQTQPTWGNKDLQDRMVDTLWHFGSTGNRWKLRMDEDQAALMWDNDFPDEDFANLRGYIACCTIDDVRHTDAKVWGFGNGGRRPDGTPI